MFVGSGIGPETRAPERFAVSTISERRMELVPVALIDEDTDNIPESDKIVALQVIVHRVYPIPFLASRGIAIALAALHFTGGAQCTSV